MGSGSTVKASNLQRHSFMRLRQQQQQPERISEYFSDEGSGAPQPPSSDDEEDEEQTRTSSHRQERQASPGSPSLRKKGYYGDPLAPPTTTTTTAPTRSLTGMVGAPLEPYSYTRGTERALGPPSSPRQQTPARKPVSIGSSLSDGDALPSSRNRHIVYPSSGGYPPTKQSCSKQEQSTLSSPRALLVVVLGICACVLLATVVVLIMLYVLRETSHPVVTTTSSPTSTPTHLPTLLPSNDGVVPIEWVLVGEYIVGQRSDSRGFVSLATHGTTVAVSESSGDWYEDDVHLYRLVNGTTWVETAFHPGATGRVVLGAQGDAMAISSRTSVQIFALEMNRWVARGEENITATNAAVALSKDGSIVAIADVSGESVLEYDWNKRWNLLGNYSPQFQDERTLDSKGSFAVDLSSDGKTAAFAATIEEPYIRVYHFRKDLWVELRDLEWVDGSLPGGGAVSMSMSDSGRLLVICVNQCNTYSYENGEWTHWNILQGETISLSEEGTLLAVSDHTDVVRLYEAVPEKHRWTQVGRIETDLAVTSVSVSGVRVALGLASKDYPSVVGVYERPPT